MSLVVFHIFYWCVFKYGTLHDCLNFVFNILITQYSDIFLMYLSQIMHTDSFYGKKVNYFIYFLLNS